MRTHSQKPKLKPKRTLMVKGSRSPMLMVKERPKHWRKHYLILTRMLMQKHSQKHSQKDLDSPRLKLKHSPTHSQMERDSPSH